MYRNVSACILASLAFVACSDSEAPSFVEDRSAVKKVQLRVEGSATPRAGDAEAMANASISPDDEAAAFDEIDAMTDGTPTVDGGAGATEGVDGVGVDGVSADGVVADAAGADGSSDGTAAGGATDGTTGGAGGEGTVTIPPSSPDGTDEPTASEARACAKLHGVPASRVQRLKSQGNQSISLDKVAAIKLTGNRARLEMDLQGVEGDRLLGICLFVAGNESQADIRVGIAVGKIAYVGRGNLSSSKFDIQAGAAVDYLAGDLAGNGAKLEMTGTGRYPCQTVRARSNSSVFTCGE